MNNYLDQLKNKTMSPREALSLLQDNDYIFCGEAASEPAVILQNMDYIKETNLKNLSLLTCLSLMDYPIFLDPEFNKIVDHQSWFFNPPQRKANKAGYLFAVPQHTTTQVKKAMDRIKATNRRSVFMTTVAPMDEEGYFNLSTCALYEWDLANQCDMLIFEVNENYPVTYGDTRIHISQVSALVNSTRPVPELPLAPFTETDDMIGKHVATLVDDGSTIQLGIGSIPNAVAANLMNKKHLGIHTELFTENMVDLINSGVVDNSMKGFMDGVTVTTFAMGTKKVYDFINKNPKICFRSSLFANNPEIIAKNNNFVSINSTLEIDLMGQCCSESIGSRQFSGTGGQVDTVIGSQRSKGGKSIMTLHSTYTAKTSQGSQLQSKIKSQLTPGAIVTTSRNDVDYVVTEYGIAWLRGASVRERVMELISIAHPDFRDQLLKEAKELGLYPSW